MKPSKLTLIGLLMCCLAVSVAHAGDLSDVLSDVSSDGALAKSETLAKADLSAVTSVKAESPDGAWVVRLEDPFVKEQPRWMPLRIDLAIAGGKSVQAVASAIHLNLAWHPVDVSGLRLTDGRLTGSLAVTFQPHAQGVRWGLRGMPV